MEKFRLVELLDGPLLTVQGSVEEIVKAFLPGIFQETVSRSSLPLPKVMTYTVQLYIIFLMHTRLVLNF